MESRLLKTLVVLGIPGVSLGVLYLLLKQFGFEFSKIGSNASAIIAMAFLLLVGGITIFALHRWAPAKGQQVGGNDIQNRNQKEIPNPEALKKMISELSRTNKKLLIEVARFPDGQYVGDLALNKNLMLTRGEIVYRGKELKSNGLLEIRFLSDQFFSSNISLQDLVENDTDLL